eukprot:3943085-Prymnesium_polylepis.1
MKKQTSGSLELMTTSGKEGTAPPRGAPGRREGLQRRVVDTAAEQPVGEEGDLHAKLARRDDDHQRRRRHVSRQPAVVPLFERRPLPAGALAERREKRREVVQHQVLAEARERGHEVRERLAAPRRRADRRVAPRLLHRHQRMELHARRHLKADALEPVAKPLGHAKRAPVALLLAGAATEERGDAVAVSGGRRIVLAFDRLVQVRLQQVEVVVGVKGDAIGAAVKDALAVARDGRRTPRTRRAGETRGQQ